MRNIYLVLEYDGTRYHGFNASSNDGPPNTILKKLTGVIQKMTGEEPVVNCGCKTEKGVHALFQAVNFLTSSDMPPEDMRTCLNRYLPLDIAILSAEEKPLRFHAALNAVSKTFLYRIETSSVPHVFKRDYTYHASVIPDTELMRQASLLLAGRHDFRCFSTAKKKQPAHKEIYDIQIQEYPGEITITIHAGDFLNNMARLLIGTLIEIGTGKRKKEEIDQIFAGTAKPGLPCSPKGLFLTEVRY